MTWANRFQRLEGGVVFLASLYFYLYLDYKILWFFVLLLTFDISMAGYFVNNKIGAHIYNIGHSFSAPILLLVFGVLSGQYVVVGFSLIWFAHIGMDRMCGFGLKFESGFSDTHLGKIGKDSKKMI